MKITAITTKKIRAGDDLLAILDRSVRRFPESGILVVTSKIIALGEGSVVPVGKVSKEALVAMESEAYVPRAKSRYGVTLAIRDGILAPSAGIDESNAEGRYVLWPRDPRASANALRAYLKKRFGVRRLGVIVTDSKTMPLRWGTTGFALAWSGFEPLKSYIGRPDLFGRKLTMTKANIADGLAAAAVTVMGEGNESTPLALIEDAPFVKFVTRATSVREARALRIAPQDDLYAPLLRGAKWKKGKKPR